MVFDNNLETFYMHNKSFSFFYKQNKMMILAFINIWIIPLKAMKKKLKKIFIFFGIRKLQINVLPRKRIYKYLILLLQHLISQNKILKIYMKNHLKSLMIIIFLEFSFQMVTLKKNQMNNHINNFSNNQKKKHSKI